MLITNHVLSGALVGAFAPGPVSAFGIGIASHFALDTVPHWGDEATFLRVAVVDGLVGLAAMGTVARLTRPERRGRVVAGMLGACLPDADKPKPMTSAERCAAYKRRRAEDAQRMASTPNSVFALARLA